MEAIRQEPVVEAKINSKPETARKFKRILKDWQLYSLLILPIIYLLIFKYGPMLGNVIAFRRFMPGGSISETRRSSCLAYLIKGMFPHIPVYPIAEDQPFL